MSNFADGPRGPVAMAACRRLQCESSDLLHLRTCTGCGEVECVCAPGEEPEEEEDIGPQIGI